MSVTPLSAESENSVSAVCTNIDNIRTRTLDHSSASTALPYLPANSFNNMTTAQQLTDSRRNFDEFLIQDVKHHNLLWDSSMWEYKDIEKRREAWLEIAANLCSSVENCKRRWEQLRGCFTKAKAKQMRDGAPPTWKFYEPLLFLSDFIVPKSYALPTMDLSSSGLLPPSMNPNDSTVYMANDSSHNFPNGAATSSNDYLVPSVESDNDMEEELLGEQQEIPSINPSLNPSLNPSMNSSMNPSINPSMNPSMNSSMNPSINPSMNPSMNPAMNPSMYPSMNLSMNPSVNPSNRSQMTYIPPTKSRRLNTHFSPMLIPNIGPPANPFNSLGQDSAQNLPLLFSAAINAACSNRSFHPQGNSSYTEEETEDTLFGRSIGKSLQRYPQNIKTQLKIDILEVFRKVDESLELSEFQGASANPSNSTSRTMNRSSPTHMNNCGTTLSPSSNPRSIDVKCTIPNGSSSVMSDNAPHSTK